MKTMYVYQKTMHIYQKTMHIYHNISLNSSHNEDVSDESCRKNQNTHFYGQQLFTKIVPLMRCGKIWYCGTGRS